MPIGIAKRGKTPIPPQGDDLFFPLPCLFVRDMSRPSASWSLQVLFDVALQDYEKQTGTKLADHPLAEQLETCHSVDSITSIYMCKFTCCCQCGRLPSHSICSFFGKGVFDISTPCQGKAQDFPFPRFHETGPYDRCARLSGCSTTSR